MKKKKLREPDVTSDRMPSTDGLLAARLGARLDDHPAGLLHLTGSEGKAERLGGILAAMRPDAEVLVLPGWDCLPFDRASPTRAVMGRRIRAIATLAEPGRIPRLVVATPDAVMQRIVPPSVLVAAAIRIARGAALEIESLAARLERIGYFADDRIDEPGEFALRGQVVDVFPAGAARPLRIEHEDGRVTAIQQYDPASQRTLDEAGPDEVLLLPVSEAPLPEGEDGKEVQRAGLEHRLPELHPELVTVFDLMPGALVVQEPRAADRRAAFLEQVADSHETRSRLHNGEGRPLAADRLYLDEAGFQACLADHPSLMLDEPAPENEAVPVFATATRPNAAFADYLKEAAGSGRRIVLAAEVDKDAATMARLAERALGRAPSPVADWRVVLKAPEASLLALTLDLPAGFVDDDETGVTVIAAADVLGSRTARAETASALLPDEAAEFRIGDAVIHLDHGVGVLQGLDTLRSEATGEAETVRLTFAGDATLMAPIDQIDRMWRYGAMEAGVTLDRLDGEAWPKRRAKVEKEIGESARRLAALARERAERTAPKLVPPRRDYERFVARFPFTETADQAGAVAAILSDLSSGRPMDRLVCGDVGFGKTEVALRAAAAVALSGKQVAIVAPTTVLVRQHLQTFRRRFAGFGIEVAHLSRLVGAKEAKQVKAGLADGRVRIVIGTHALAGKGVGFADLGLLAIDEEQHFGAADKAKLRALGADAHVLTMTATPIPRTFQAALVGLQDLSVLATPPAERRPVRTFVTAFDEATVREALLRERRRGGQSFVVCPRVEDIAPMADRLGKLVPELALFVAHGKMPAANIDESMVRFADGEGDVLLATNIIESGLDVPRANTMVVWRPDRFGLSQLHQLRGRVGRGRQRGICYLMVDPHHEIAPATRKRLETLEQLDRLGAGFALSERDLDLRGAGDLLGDDQAGHVKLIGAGLYRRLLERALKAARGEAADEIHPEINAGATGLIPPDYVPEPELRLNLYARIAVAGHADAGESLADEIADRFGPLPEAVERLISLARLRGWCRERGIVRLDAGPQAIAVTFEGARRKSRALAKAVEASTGGALAWRDERLVWSQPSDDESRLSAIAELLDRLPPAGA